MWGSEGSVPGPQTGRGATRKSLRRTRSAARSVGMLTGVRQRSRVHESGVALFWRARLRGGRD